MEKSSTDIQSLIDQQKYNDRIKFLTATNFETKKLWCHNIQEAEKMGYILEVLGWTVVRPIKLKFCWWRLKYMYRLQAKKPV